MFSHVPFPFLRDICQGQRRDVWHPCVTTFEHKPLVILFARLSLFSLSYFGIPVTESQCVWPDYNGYRHTEWARSEYLLHREGANPILTLSQPLAPPSDIPRTYFTTSHLREDSSKNQSMSSCVKQLDTLMV